MAIRSIAHRGLKRVFEEHSTRGLDPRYADKIRDMLDAIDQVTDVSETERLPGWRLHALTGNLDGFYSLTVTGNQCLIFGFEVSDAFDLDLVDYH